MSASGTPTRVPAPVHPESRRSLARGGFVADVSEGVGLVAAGGEEPRLHEPAVADALDPPASLGEPDVPQPAPEQPPLILAGGALAERPQPIVDDLRVHPLPVVGAGQLMAPVEQGRNTQPPQL